VGSLLAESPRLGSVLEQAIPLRVDGRVLVLGFPESATFVRRAAEQATSRETIIEHIATAVGFKYGISTEQVAEPEPDPAAESQRGIDKDELIEMLKQEFDATEIA
jgi:hypothetical protein